MSAGSRVPEDDTLPSRLERKLFRLETWLALAGGFAILALMGLAVASVGGRNFLNAPLPGYIDWIEQAMPLVAFAGISYCQRSGAHIRMDVLVTRLRGRPLQLAEFTGTLLALVLMLLLVWGSWAHFGRSLDWHAPLWSRDSSLDIRLPLWPAKLLVPAAFSVLCLRLSLQLWIHGRAFLKNTASPAGVPRIADPASVAADEAMHVSGAVTGDNGNGRTGP